MRLSMQNSCLVDDKDMPKGHYEEYGVNNRCFKWRHELSNKQILYTPRCHKARCEDGKVIITLSSTDFVCTKSYELIQVDEHESITCPLISDFCQQLSTKCPNDCNANGLCMQSKKCHCYRGFKGEDCSVSA